MSFTISKSFTILISMNKSVKRAQKTAHEPFEPDKVALAIAAFSAVSLLCLAVVGMINS